MRYLVLLLAEIALTTYCVVGVLRHPDDNPHGLNRTLWVLVLLLLPYVPELAWLYLQWRAAEANTPHLRNRRAPDDDPDYLRWLNEQQRRRREEG